MKSISGRLGFILVSVWLLISYGYQKVEGAEPPELSGPDKKVEELSKEEKQAGLEMLKAFELLRDEKDAQKIKEAIDKFSKVIELNPEYSDAYFVRAMAYFHFLRSKDYQKIIDDLDNSIKFFSSKKYKSAYESNASKYSLRAKAYKEMGNYRQAIEDLERAANLDSKDVINSGGVDPDEPAPPGIWGKKDFEEIIQKFPKDFRGYMVRGLFYDFFTKFDGKNYAFAISDYKKAITLNPKSALCHYLLGKTIKTKIWWNPKIKGAEDYQKEAKATMAGLSVYTVYPEDYKDIITELSEAIRLNPQMVNAYLERAGAYLVAKEYRLAIKDYDKIIELDPDYGGTYHDRAIAHQDLGNYYEAIDSFSKAIKAKKQITAPYSAYENRAKAYIKVGDYENAINDFSKAIELYLGNSVLLMNVSQFRKAYPEYNNVSDESLAKKLHQKFYPNLKYEDFAKMFLKENKGDYPSSIIPDLYVSRGDAYLNFGYYKKAIQDYDRAIKAFDYAQVVDRWRLFATSSEGKHYIDVKTVTYPQKGNVRFWAKTTYNTPQKSNVDYSLQNWEVSCSSKMIKGFSFIDYDSNGNAINQSVGTGWKNIVPDSIGEELHKGWCRELK